MGNYSWLRKMINNPDGCRINWEKANTQKLFKKWFMEHCFLMDNTQKTQRPTTLADMAKLWDNTKFIQYFDNNYIESLQEFSRILEPCNAFPRLYYEFEGYDELYCLEFHPGTTNIYISSTCFTKFLKEQNIPKHPEELKDINTISEQEYIEWEKIYDEAKTIAIERSIESIDVWKPWQVLKPTTVDELELFRQFLIQIKD